MSSANPPSSPQIGLPPEQFAAAFPFHFAVDRHLRFQQAGPTLRRICPDVQPGAILNHVFRAIQPEGQITVEWVLGNAARFFLLEHRASKLQLRGEFVVLPGGKMLLFLGSPWFTDSSQIAAHNLRFNDFAIHDPVVDMLQVYQANKLALAEAKKLAAKLTTQRAELRAANERLLQQEAEARKLALIAARTDNAVVLTDAQGLTVWVNEGFTRLTGYTSREMLGKKPGAILQGPATDPETIRHMGERLRRGEGFSVEILNYAKDGRSYWLAVEVQPILDEQGQVTNFMAIETDITARRATQQRLAIQFEVSRVLAQATHYSRAILEVLRVICENLDWQVGQLWRLAGDRLRFVEVWHPSTVSVPDFIAASRAMEFEHGVGLPGRIWAAAQPAWIADVTRDANFPRGPAAAQAGLRGAFGFPVFVRGELWGVVEFFSRKIEEPDAPLLKTFGAVGNQIGQFIVRRQAEEKLRESEAQYRELFERTSDLIQSVAEDGSFIYVNRAWQHCLGYSDEDLRNLKVWDIIHPDCRQHYAAIFERLMAGEQVGRVEVKLQTKSGQTLVTEGLVYVSSVGGKVKQTRGMFRDITMRVQAEATLVKAKEDAEAANLAKSEFLATISHELRTPLTSIRGFLQTLLSDPDLPAQARQEFLTITHDQSLRLSRLVDDLLDLSSLESGRTQFNDELVDLRQIAEVCLAGIDPLAASKAQQVESEIADPLPAYKGDAVRLHSVFTNLLSNAVKFTPPGGTVRLELGLSNDAIRIVVQDTGPGIPADQHKMIFEKFHRVYRRGASVAGTGLGLPIVKAIVDHYRGRIELESEEGQGSCFRVFLPLQTASNIAGGTISSRPPATTSSTTSSS